VKWRLELGGVAIALLACGELADPRANRVALSIVPVFDASGVFAGNNADRLRIRVQRENLGTFQTVKDTTVTIDADGTASADINVVLVQSPQLFRVLLDAFRASDVAVLFSGSEDVVVTSGGGPQEVQVPIGYSGPHGAGVVVAPKDTNVTAGGSFAFRATVFDANGSVVGVPVTFHLINPADASKLRVSRLAGLATAVAGQQGTVLVLALTADSLRDTARVVVRSATASVQVTPGYGSVGVGQALQLAGAALDFGGNTLGGRAFSWTSRTPSVASVGVTGLVAGLAPGTTVVVAASGSAADSIRVIVPKAGDVVVWTTSGGRAFGAGQVGSAFEVDVTADLALAPGERLASYNGTLTWNATKAAFVDTLPGGFAGAQVNIANVGTGELRFTGADPAGAAGTPTLVKIRFHAVSAGSMAPVLVISEMSGPSPTVTNFISPVPRVDVASGDVAVSP